MIIQLNDQVIAKDKFTISEGDINIFPSYHFRSISNSIEFTRDDVLQVYGLTEGLSDFKITLGYTSYKRLNLFTISKENFEEYFVHKNEKIESKHATIYVFRLTDHNVIEVHHPLEGCIGDYCIEHDIENQTTLLVKELVSSFQ